MNWQPIETCPADDTVFFAWYYKPSEAAAKNGANSYWAYGSGSKIMGSKMMKPIYTGILGGKPSHWALATPPTTGV